MTISSEDFKDALRHFAAGVTVVAAGAGAERYGMTVSAFVSVSADPPLVAVFLNSEKRIHELLAPEGAGFGVSILGEDQAEVSNRFAFSKDEDRFAADNWGTATTGAPVLLDAVAWLDCVVEERQPAGSHVMVLGRVVASRVEREDVPPLVYWNRAYRRLTEDA